MAIIDLFAEASSRAKLSQLKQMLNLAICDGSVHPNELASIAAFMSREGLSTEDMERCIKNPGSIGFELPSDENTKVKYLRDMVLLMLADGRIETQEVVLCNLTAEALGYDRSVVDQMVLDLVEEIKSVDENGADSK